MKPSEVTALCAYIVASKPSHRFDEATVNAWKHILGHVPVEDARLVVNDLIGAKEWIDSSDIVKAVKRLRRDRLASSGFAELTPNVEPLIALEDGRTVENPAHRAEKLALRDAIASGGMSENEVAAYARGEVPTLTGAPPAFVAGALVSRRMPELCGVTRQPEPE